MQARCARGLAIALVAIASGCCFGGLGASTPVPVAAGPTATAPPVIAPPVIAPPPATPPTAVPGVLPRAEDVLPPGEVSADALVVAGEGYRFQIRPALTEVPDAPGTRAFRGRLEGMMRPTDVSVWMAREPYAGDLAALVEQYRTINVTAEVTQDTPVTIARAGEMTQSAHRFVFTGSSSVRMLVLAVDGGHSYTFRCELPPEPNAWINAGVDCMIMGSTLHIAPP